MSIIAGSCAAAGANIADAQIFTTSDGMALDSVMINREFEREADRIGVELAARAGYDPRAAISLWQKMTQVGGGRIPQFLSTHPSDESRIRDLQGYAARVMPLYEAARRR